MNSDASTLTPLRKIRLQRNITLTKMSASTGISKSALSRYEKDQQMPNRQHARKIYLFFNGELDITKIYDPFFPAIANKNNDHGKPQLSQLD